MFTDIEKIEELIPKLKVAAAAGRNRNSELAAAVLIIAEHICKVEHARRMLEDCDDD